MKVCLKCTKCGSIHTFNERPKPYICPKCQGKRARVIWYSNGGPQKQ